MKLLSVIWSMLRPVAVWASAQGQDTPNNTTAQYRAERRQTRIQFVIACFALIIVAVGAKMVMLATSVQEEKATSYTPKIYANRADITDRNGQTLATTFDTYALYVEPHRLIDKEHTIKELSNIFPQLSEDRLRRLFASGKKHIWLLSQISPEERQAVQDIGEPALYGPRRDMRFYPRGKIAAHILGGVKVGAQGMSSAQLIGAAGIEQRYDAYLNASSSKGSVLALSIDASVQFALEQVLEAGMNHMSAKSAAAVLMDAHSGEIIALASLPTFDPNDRPSAFDAGTGAQNPTFNHAVQGAVEMGSVLKPFAIAQALELGLVGPQTAIDTRGPLKVGRFKIRDFKNYGPRLSVQEVLVKSSNIGTARIAQLIGPKRQQEFLGNLGLLTRAPIELPEAILGKPSFAISKETNSSQLDWGDVYSVTISYGHGITTSPLILASAYAALVNGGLLVQPTLLARQKRPVSGTRVISQKTSAIMRDMMRRVVTEGTARAAEAPGYHVGGKTGTASKINPKTGRYHEDLNLNTFAGFFPANAPKYVLVVMMDEPADTVTQTARRTAGYTVVPVVKNIIERIAPMIGMMPQENL